MQFNSYLQNVELYIDQYYEHLLKEMEIRPESSYPILLEEERATFSRYAHAVLKEMMFGMQDELEQHVSEEEAEKRVQELSEQLRLEELTPMAFTVKAVNNQASSMVVRTRSLSSDSGTRSPLQSNKVTLGNSAASGILIGGVLGGLLGKTIVLSAIGAISGGVIGSSLAYYYMQQRRDNQNVRNERISIPAEPPVVAISELIGQRRQHVHSYFVKLIQQVEHKYTSMNNKY